MTRKEHGWIRNATITEAIIQGNSNGRKWIACRTDKTGASWVYLPRTYFDSIVNSLDAMISLNVVPEMVCQKLRGMSCDVRVQHNYDTGYDGLGKLAHTWDAKIHPHMIAAISDYRLGEGGHG